VWRVLEDGLTVEISARDTPTGPEIKLYAVYNKNVIRFGQDKEDLKDILHQ
jgi:hypothetical protein